jgi:predicted ATPase
MFLRRLRLKNVRSISKLDMTFEGTKASSGRAWTFLLGENGSGKSTVLRSIALALAGSEALPQLLGDHDWWIREGETEAEIEIEVATAKNERRTARLAFARGSTTLRFLTDNHDTLEELDSALAHAARNYFVVGYGVARRPPQEMQSAKSVASTVYRTDRAQNVSTLFTGSATLVSLEQWAIDLDYRRGARGLEVVRTALDSLLPDVRFDGIEKERRRLRFRTPDGLLPLDLLSDGYQAMAAWCGDLLYRITETFSNYEKALSARGLLLIDEIDLHLHPLWQRELVLFLRQTLPNFQVVATTHSPLTIHQAGDGELFVLRRENPRSPAAIHPFNGAPNTFLLHQLIQSPIFGLDTLESPQTAKLQNEIRTAKGLPIAKSSVRVVPANSAAKPKKISIRRQEALLSSLLDSRKVPNYLQQTNHLLERLATEIASTSNSAPGRPAIRQAARKASALRAKK